MEDVPESVQVGMSNAVPGGAPGGVLATGKMQEPAFFASRAELLVALLVVPTLAPNEAALVQGARQFAASVGFGEALRAREATASEVVCAASQDLLLVDALDLRKADAPMEFSKAAVDRELLKLYAGFRLAATARTTAVTGNWCCDAFGGDKQLKAVMQLIAASAAGVKKIVLCPNAFEGDTCEPWELPALRVPPTLRTSGAMYSSLLDFLPRGHLFSHVNSTRSQQVTCAVTVASGFACGFASAWMLFRRRIAMA